MSAPDYLPLRQKIVKTAQTLIEREAISPAHLSNISIRVPGGRHDAPHLRRLDHRHDDR